MAKRIPTFGWKAWKLSDLSFDELNELRGQITSDPRNANPQHASGQSIYLYTPAARSKLDALAWAVSYKLADARKAAA